MWLVATILGIFLFFVVLLSIPADFAFQFEREADCKSRLRVEWLFGLVGMDVRPKRKPERPEKKEKKREKEKKRKTRVAAALVKNRNIVQKSLAFARDIFRLLKIRDFTLHLRIGFYDPADTGLLFAALGPFLVFTKSAFSSDIQIQPDFNQETLQYQCRGYIRVFPIQVVATTIPFILSPTVLRSIKAVVAAR